MYITEVRFHDGRIEQTQSDDLLTARAVETKFVRKNPEEGESHWMDGIKHVEIFVHCVNIGTRKVDGKMVPVYKECTGCNRCNISKKGL